MWGKSRQCGGVTYLNQASAHDHDGHDYEDLTRSGRVLYLVVRLRIEEDNKLAQKDTYTPDSAKANMVEHAGSSSRFNSKGNKKDKKKNDKKGKGKSEYLAPKAGIVKQKFQGTCYNCDQPGHRAANCKMPKRVNPRQANMVDENVDMIAMVSDMCAMISEVNLVGTNNSGWWIDTGATRHVCADKSMFHSFRRLEQWTIAVLWALCNCDIKVVREIIFVVRLAVKTSFGFRLVFESDKFVLSKNQMYVGKGYAVNAMFKLNVMVVKNDINKMNSSAYLIESSNVWHGRLGHYCYVYLLKSKDEAIDMLCSYKTEVANQHCLCGNMGIRHEFTAPYSPQQNGIAERKNRTLKEMVTAMLISSGSCALPKAKSKDLIIVDCIFIGYAKKNTAYRFIETGSSSRLDDKVVQDKRQRDDNDLQDERQDQTEEEEVEPRRSKRARNEKSFGPDFVSFMVENEPTSYGSVGYKWIFKKKMKADGTVDKYKARLVIQGFRQREGLDYFDTYSPVTRITSIRMIIAIAALRNLEIHQMDVKTAFLNGDLEEEIYMNQPEGFIAPGQEGKGRLRCKGVMKQIVGVIPKGLALRVVLVNLHFKDESGKKV
ncbi:retrovirus-related pol polyprotein from transposon TNT 1-94 [Tanacetum coccineum]